MACEIFKSQSNQGGLEAGDIERTEYVACNKKGGVCLELATLDLDEGEPKERLPTIDIKILFDYDKASIRSGENGKLSQIADALKAPVNANTKFAIIGHTDAKGTKRYNCRLSTARARAVSASLAASGIPPDHLITIGAGEYILRYERDDEDAQNRRVGFARFDDSKGEVVARLSRLCDNE